MKVLRKSLPFAAALLLLTPSCVVAVANKAASPHPHADCPICSSEPEKKQASAAGHLERTRPAGAPAIEVVDQPVLAARQ